MEKIEDGVDVEKRRRWGMNRAAGGCKLMAVLLFSLSTACCFPLRPLISEISFIETSKNEKNEERRSGE